MQPGRGAVIDRAPAQAEPRSRIGLDPSSIGGALVPLSVPSAWVAVIAPASPGYWAAHGLRAALAGDTYTVAIACGTLLGAGLIFSVLASVRLKGRSGRLVAV